MHSISGSPEKPLKKVFLELLLAFLVSGFVAFLPLYGWFFKIESIPMGDFGGTGAWLQYLIKILVNKDFKSVFLPSFEWNFGGFFLNVFPPFHLFALSLPGILFTKDTLLILKVGTVFWRLVGGAGIYFLIKDFLLKGEQKTAFSLLGVILWGIFPYFVSEASFYSHLDIIVFLGILPWFLWGFWHMLSSPKRWNFFLSSFLLSALITTQHEMAFLLLLLLLLFLFYFFLLQAHLIKRRLPEKKVKIHHLLFIAILSILIGGLVSSWWGLPALKDLKDCALFPAKYLPLFRKAYSLQNLKWLFKPISQGLHREIARVLLKKFPISEAERFLGVFYAGLLPFLIWALTGMWLTLSYLLKKNSQSEHIKKETNPDLWTVTSFLIGFTALWFSFGPWNLINTGNGIVGKFIRYYLWLIPLISMPIVHARYRKILLLTSLLFLLLPHFSPFTLLTKLPYFSHLRVPNRFFPFFSFFFILTLTAGLERFYLLIKKWKRKVAAATVFFLAIITITDYSKYARFSSWFLYPEKEVKALKSILEESSNVLFINLNPLYDFLLSRMDEKHRVRTWVEWSSPRSLKLGTDSLIKNLIGGNPNSAIFLLNFYGIDTLVGDTNLEKAASGEFVLSIPNNETLKLISETCGFSIYQSKNFYVLHRNTGKTKNGFPKRLWLLKAPTNEEVWSYHILNPLELEVKVPSEIISGFKKNYKSIQGLYVKDRVYLVDLASGSAFFYSLKKKEWKKLSPQVLLDKTKEQTMRSFRLPFVNRTKNTFRSYVFGEGLLLSKGNILLYLSPQDTETPKPAFGENFWEGFTKMRKIATLISPKEELIIEFIEKTGTLEISTFDTHSWRIISYKKIKFPYSFPRAPYLRFIGMDEVGVYFAIARQVFRLNLTSRKLTYFTTLRKARKVGFFHTIFGNTELDIRKGILKIYKRVSPQMIEQIFNPTRIEIKSIHKNPGFLYCKFYTQKPGIVVLPVSWLRGWSLKLDGAKIPERECINVLGLIGLEVDKGEHHITAKYVGRKTLRLIGTGLSVAGLLFLSLILCLWNHIWSKVYKLHDSPPRIDTKG